MTSNDDPNTSLALHSCGDTSALHASIANGLNLVAIGNLRVMIKTDGKHWTAQGLEIDYAVDGSSLKDVTEEFAMGLALTFDDHLRVHGNILKTFRLAPESVWKEFFECAGDEKFTHYQLSVHNIPMTVVQQKAA